MVWNMFTYMYPKFMANVGKHIPLHGAYMEGLDGSRLVNVGGRVGSSATATVREGMGA